MVRPAVRYVPPGPVYGSPVSITEDAPAPAQAPPRSIVRTASGRPSPWWLLVAICVLVLVAVATAITTWWAATRETRTTSYRVLGDLAGIRLDLGAADVEIDGGAGAVEVRRVDRFAFGHPSGERRAVAAGVLTVASRCPAQVLGTCRTAYRVAVPDNVPVTLRTSSGSVRLVGVRASVTVTTSSGPVVADAFCGFSLRASSDTGAVRAVTQCSPDRLELRSRSGDVRAAVPPGRYRVDAQSASGRLRVRGLTLADDAPFQIQALSTTGDVTVEGTP